MHPFGRNGTPWLPFLNAPETTVSGYKIAEVQRRFDKSKEKINAVVTEDNFKDLYQFSVIKFIQKESS